MTDALAREGLLSDERYIEAYHQSRVRRGWGPLRIRADLREHGISDALIDAYVDINADYWWDVIRAARTKRFGDAPPQRFEERAKQARYLQSRGFTAEQVRGALKSSHGEDDET